MSTLPPASAAHPDRRARAILAIDTATTHVVVASGTPDGQIDGLTTWTAGYRHGETLLPSIARFLADQGLDRSSLGGIVVGTGPGAFTGLRVGIATAKGLAHGLGLPIAGVSTAEAILAAAIADAASAGTDATTQGETATGRPVLLLPAGPSDRIMVRPGSAPELLPGGTDPELAPGEWLVAVDLEGRAPDDAARRGEQARQGLAAALVRLGAERLRPGPADDLAGLVPEYVTLPRGVARQVGEVAWSRDRR